MGWVSGTDGELRHPLPSAHRDHVPRDRCAPRGLADRPCFANSAPRGADMQGRLRRLTPESRITGETTRGTDSPASPEKHEGRADEVERQN